jgi:hypothetical protein
LVSQEISELSECLEILVEKCVFFRGGVFGVGRFLGRLPGKQFLEATFDGSE